MKNEPAYEALAEFLRHLGVDPAKVVQVHADWSTATVVIYQGGRITAPDVSARVIEFGGQTWYQDVPSESGDKIRII